MVYCKLKGGGCGATGIERVFGFLAPLIFHNVDCCCPEWVVMGGRAFKDNVCVGVSVGRVASDYGPEIADAAFPMEIHLPVKEGVCMCSVFLKCR
jgi:hypothetical protein